MNPLDFVAVVSELDADTNEGQEVECPECQKPFISSKTLMVYPMKMFAFSSYNNVQIAGAY
jgi:hypothetical protein